MIRELKVLETDELRVSEVSEARYGWKRKETLRWMHKVQISLGNAHKRPSSFRELFNHLETHSKSAYRECIII
jgi:hypothetical protein